MIPKSLYPREPWPLERVSEHPCLEPLLAKQRTEGLKADVRENLRVLFLVLDRIGQEPAKWQVGLPVMEAFEGIELDRFDFLIDELAKLKLMEVRQVAGVTQLVPFRSVELGLKVRYTAATYYLPVPLVETIREHARNASINQSKIIEDGVKLWLAAKAS